MSDHVLDRPIWSALTSRHAPFAIGTSRAKRYPSDVSPFVVVRDDSDKSVAELIELLPEAAGGIIMQKTPTPVPRELGVTTHFGGVQMLADNLKSAPPSAQIVELGDRDAADMLELATLTAPGPFLRNTHRLGGFIGMRDGEGRLIAMAGQRLHLDGWCEVSAVCTYPDHRGKGHAGLMLLTVANRIADRGERPFLHTYERSKGAISLDESLGFKLRTPMTIQIVKRVSV